MYIVSVRMEVKDCKDWQDLAGGAINIMLIADKWQDYEILDTGNGEKLERWGPYTLRRPDPQVIWPASLNKEIWDKADGVYHRSNSGGGSWEYRKQIPSSWKIKYNDLAFKIEPTGFKHTGLFPEQAVNWDWMASKIKAAGKESGRTAGQPIKVLNLFAYTGGATVACTKAGATVCHVDAAKGMVSWAKENLGLSNLANRPARFIVDDCMKFIKREQRRESKYDAVIMDPPSYGRGPGGEVWKIEDTLYNFVEEIAKILSDKPLFVLINSYTTGFAPTVTENILKLTVNKKFKGIVTSGEVGLRATKSGIVLPCGIYGRWERSLSP